MRRLYLLALLTGSLVFLSSCGDDPGFTVQVVPTAVLVVVNTIPDSPLLSVVASNQVIGQLQFGQSSDFSQVLPQIPIEIRVEFLDNETISTLIESTVTIEIDNTQFVVLTGTMAGPELVVVNNLPIDIQEGVTTTLVKFLNVTSSVNSATLTLTDSEANVQTITLTNGQTSESVPVAFGEGLQIEVTDTDGGNLLWSSGDFDLTLAAGRLIILSDYFGPGAETVRMFSAIELIEGGLFINEQLDSVVRFANMTPDRGPLDVSVDGNSLAINLAFGDVTGFLPVSPGTFDFSVSVFGDAADIVSTTETTILPGNFYTFGFTGLTEGNDGSSFAIDVLRRVPSRATLKATQLAPSFGAIDIFLLTAGQTIDDVFPVIARIIQFATFSLSAPSNTYDLVIINSDTRDTLFGPQSVTIETNKVYSVLLTDSPGGGPPLQVVFLDDFIQ